MRHPHFRVTIASQASYIYQRGDMFTRIGLTLCIILYEKFSLPHGTVLNLDERTMQEFVLLLLHVYYS